MQNIELPSQKLLVSDDIEEGTVALYLSLLARGFRDAVGRVIAAPIDQKDHHTDIGKTSHLIIDGNHRAVSYALIERIIPIIEIVDQSDVLKCREMARTGEIASFAHSRGKYHTIVNEGVSRSGVKGQDLHKYVREALRSQLIEFRQLPMYVRKIIKSKK